MIKQTHNKLINNAMQLYAIIKVFYKINVFGDIIGICNSAGNVVARYIYDARGFSVALNPDGTHNTANNFIGNLNPWRWRGQYFDTDSGFYMIPSNGITRYYDPRLGQIINATLDEALMDGEYAHGMKNPLEVFGNTFSAPTWGYPSVYVPEIPETAFTRFWNWWNDLHWGWRVGIGVGVVAGLAIIAVATKGTAIGGIFLALTKGAAISGGIGVGVGIGMGLIETADSGDWNNVGMNILNSAAGGFAVGAISGAIMGGMAQGISGGFKLAVTKFGAKAGAKKGGIALGKKVKILSPNSLKHFEAGGTLIKFGKAMRIDVGTQTLLHMHTALTRGLHIPLGSIFGGVGGGIIGGLW